MSGVCDTCSEEADEFFVYALAGIPMTVGNCRFCAQWELYPYHVVVANTAALGGLEGAADWWRDVVQRSCIRERKLMEEFLDDVQRALGEEDGPRRPDEG